MPATTPRFELGRVVATPGSLAALAANRVSPLTYLARHSAGDWGNLSPADRAANERALRDGTRLLSAYTLPDASRLWVITEADRSVTTLLLPDEY